MEIRRFYVPHLTGSDDVVELPEDESRHLRSVLRLRSGDSISAFDGNGREFQCVIEKVEKRTASVRIIEEIEPEAKESSLDLSIACTLLKGEKLDGVVRQAVELGVRAFFPITSARCDVRSRDSAGRIERWRRIAVEATKQCGRARLMSISPLSDPAAVLGSERFAGSTRILFSERGGDTFDSLGSPGKIFALFGPEGGWDDAELTAAEDLGAKIVTFGGRIMKADTAAVAISAILQHRFGDIN